MERITTTLICDVCGKDEDTAPGIEPHAVAVDGAAFEGEAHPACWAKATKALGGFLGSARPVKAPAPAKRVRVRPSRAKGAVAS